MNQGDDFPSPFSKGDGKTPRLTSKTNGARAPFPASADGELPDIVTHLLRVGGPSESDFPALDAFAAAVEARFANGTFSREHLRSLWRTWGDQFLQETLWGHVYRKPYGYPGDFEIIDRIYRGEISHDPVLAGFDRYFQTRAAPQAVRNRKDYFKALLLAHAGEASGKRLSLLNLGSGSARDVFEHLTEQPDSPWSFDCVDVDERAVAFAQNLCRGFAGRVRFEMANAVRYRPRQAYDLIWSAGLFDYLPDRLLVPLLKRLVAATRPGGEVIIGNFSPANPTRAFMAIGEWHLIHRTEEEFLALADAAGVAPAKCRVHTEPAGINLFLHIQT
jgi:SAM-dependent methyltransferase